MSQRVNIAQQSFAAGEISPQLWGRTDLVKYRTGAGVMRNMYVDYRGGAFNRAGTQIVGPNPDGGRQPRLIPFVFNQTQAYILEFDDRGMRVISGGQYITTTAKAITGVSHGSPIVLTVNGHGLSTNDRFYVTGVNGCLRTNGVSGLNGQIFEIASVTPNTITLKSPWNFTLSSSTWTAYSSGGQIEPIFEVSGASYAPLENIPLQEMNYVQSGDILTLTHPLMPPQNVSRLAEDSWTITRDAIGPKLTPPTGLGITQQNQDPSRVQYVYTYCVTAANSDTKDESAASAAISTTMSAVRNADSETVTTSRKLTWNAVDGANLYKLYKAQVTPKGTPPTPPYTWGLIGETTALSYQDLNYAPDYTRAPPINRNPFSDGTVAEIGIVDSGFGYLNPLVTITDAGPGTGATANAAIDTHGAVTGINVANPGTKYTAPSVSITEANFVAGTGATIAFSGSWTGSGPYDPAGGSITITDGGTGYHVPQIAATGPDLSTAGNGYGTMTSGVLTGFTWLTPPQATTNTATMTITVTDMAPGWTPPHPSPNNSQALAIATLGDQINPRCVTYFQQRKTYGGGDEPTTFWMSKPGLYSNFDITYPSEDDDSITGPIVGPEVNEIVSLVSVSNGLLALTTGGAYLISGGQPATPVTPSSISALPQVSSGSSLLAALIMASEVVYLQSRGTSVRTLSYSFQVDSYQGADVSALSAHLLENRTIKEWAWAEEPRKLLWCVRDDGVMLSLAYIKEQEVYGWSRHDTQGEFVSVATIPEDNEDAIYVVTRRIINGGFYYLTERMASRNMGGNAQLGIPTDPEQAWFVDSGARYPLTEPDADLSAGEPQTGLVQSVTVLDGGTDYPADAVVEVYDPTGTGATATATVVGGTITAIAITNAGSGYTAPRLEVSGGRGGLFTIQISSPQTFTTSAAITANEGDVLRVGGGKGIVTDVTSATEFTCNMIVPIAQHVPNTSPTTVAPIIAVSGDWSLTTPVTTVGGLDHLTGQTVVGLADGSLVSPVEVVDGCVTLPYAATSIVLGLGYTSQLQTLRMDVGDPPISGRRRTVPSVTVRVVDTRGIFIGYDFKRIGAMVEQKNRALQLPGQPIYFQTGGGLCPPIFEGMPTAPNPFGYSDIFMNIQTNWNKEGYVCIQQSYPLPMGILDVIPNIVVGDEGG